MYVLRTPYTKDVCEPSEAHKKNSDVLFSSADFHETHYISVPSISIHPMSSIIHALHFHMASWSSLKFCSASLGRGRS